MKIVSWNVNGLRAVLSKNKLGIRDTGEKNVLESLMEEYNIDILCLQETKCPEDYDFKMDFVYKKIIASKTRKGYSGVAIFSKIKPLNEIINFKHNEEGRFLALEFKDFYLINTYTPNSKADLSRLSYRTDIWEKEIIETVNLLQNKKPIVFVSDFNVAPTELDIHTVKGHEKMHGFTIEERTAFAELLNKCKLVDSYRYLYGNNRKYTWFSNFGQSRKKNKGWRIDMALLSQSLCDKLKASLILEDYYGSDHLPILIEF